MLVHNELLFFATVRISLCLYLFIYFSLSFSCLIILCLSVDLHLFIFLGLIELGSFQALFFFFQIFFLSLSISPLSRTPIVYIGMLDGVIGLLGPFYFLLYSFFFLLRRDNFSWQWFLCLLKCAFETLMWILHFSCIKRFLFIIFSLLIFCLLRHYSHIFF